MGFRRALPRTAATLGLTATVLGCAVTTPQATEPSAQGWMGTHETAASQRQYTGFQLTASEPQAALEPGCPVDIILDGAPERAYSVLGLASVERVGAAISELPGGQEHVIEWLRPVACAAGGNVLFDLRTATDWAPYVGRSIRGTAVVAVYTDGAMPPAPVVQPAPTPDVAPPPPVDTAPVNPPIGWGQPEPPPSDPQPAP